jgi:hypothetical protein
MGNVVRLQLLPELCAVESVPPQWQQWFNNLSRLEDGLSKACWLGSSSSSPLMCILRTSATSSHCLENWTLIVGFYLKCAVGCRIQDRSSTIEVHSVSYCINWQSPFTKFEHQTPTPIQVFTALPFSQTWNTNHPHYLRSDLHLLPFYLVILTVIDFRTRECFGDCINTYVCPFYNRLSVLFPSLLL